MNESSPIYVGPVCAAKTREGTAATWTTRGGSDLQNAETLGVVTP